MMSGVVGGNLESLSTTSSTFTSTGASASESGQLGVQFGDQMREGLDEVTRVLQDQFTSMAEEFRSLASTTQSELNSTDWEGARRQRALEVGEQLKTDVDAVIDASETHISSFRTDIVNAAVTAAESLRSEFQTAMDTANENYAAISKDASQMREGLANLDAGGLG